MCSHTNNLKFYYELEFLLLPGSVEYLHAQQTSPEFTVLPMICALAAYVGYVLYFMCYCQGLRVSSRHNGFMVDLQN